MREQHTNPQPAWPDNAIAPVALHWLDPGLTDVDAQHWVPGLTAAELTIDDLCSSLVRSGALTTFQAGRLLDTWPELEPDWSAHPYFRSVREHTRAAIDGLLASARGGA